jgi:DNA polymerase-3 subunit epsilon
MTERLGLRLRIFLFFALIAGGAVLALLGAGVLAARRAEPQAVPDIVLGLGLAAFCVTGLCAWVWFRFDEHVARPIVDLSAEIRAALHAGAQALPEPSMGRYLGLLAPTAREVITALALADERRRAAVAEATAEAEFRKQQLETVLRDLDHGVVICSLDHRIRLYNRRALALLHVSGDLGLDRSLLGLVMGQPVRHALQRLVGRFESGRHRDHPDGLSVLAIITTTDRSRQISARMTLAVDSARHRPSGYTMTFDDVTDALSAGLWRDRLLADVTADMRRRVTELALAAEVFAARVPAGEPDLDMLRLAIAAQPAALAERLDRLDEAANDLIAGAWPMAGIISPTLFALVRDRRSEGRDLTISSEGGSLWLTCDSASIVDLLDRLMNRVAVYAGVDAFRLAASRGENLASAGLAHVDLAHVDLAWAGEAVPFSILEIWLDERLDDGLGSLTGRDVLNRHRTDVWCEHLGGGEHVLRLPLALHEPRVDLRVRHLPARPEFYDFDIAGPGRSRIEDVPLRSLSLVVFDTETTGLEPSRGDAIVQIAGVRIVNGRLMSGEIFDSYVDPRRPIPAASTRVHGITEEMVRGADPIERVLPRFHAFLDGGVLVAHNAAFDMAFLTRHAAEAGVSFDSPVLDTVLLAAHLFGTTQSLTLDALAARFGIDLPEDSRHTALGDSLATARVLLRLFDLLEAEGIRDLRQALEVSRRQVAIRRAQKAY